MKKLFWRIYRHTHGNYLYRSGGVVQPMPVSLMIRNGPEQPFVGYIRLIGDLYWRV